MTGNELILTALALGMGGTVWGEMSRESLREPADVAALQPDTIRFDERGRCVHLAGHGTADKPAGMEVTLRLNHSDAQGRRTILTEREDCILAAEATIERLTAAMWVNSDASIEQLRDTLAHGVDLNAPCPDADEPGRNYFTYLLCFMFTEQQAAEKLQILLDAGADIHTRDAQGDTPLTAHLHRTHNPTLVKALLSAGAEPDTANNDGVTPLMRACSSYFDPDIVQMLLHAGANAKAADKQGRTPLHYALNVWLPTGWAPDCDGDASEEELDRVDHEAVQRIVTNIRSLVAAGADVNARDAKGRTPLLMLPEKDNDLPLELTAPIIGTLIELGADLSATDNTKRTICDYIRQEAAQRPLIYTPLISALQKHGVTIALPLAETEKP